MREFRKHLGWYTKGIPDSRRLRQRLFRVRDLQEVREVLEGYLDERMPTRMGEDRARGAGGFADAAGHFISLRWRRRADRGRAGPLIERLGGDTASTGLVNVGLRAEVRGPR